MKILAFDTSSDACSVALLDSDLAVDEPHKTRHQYAPMQQAKLILPMIHDLLSASSLTPTDLDAIAYGCGPGSFTGIRIASSVVQGIGITAKNLPIIQISSLAAMAQAAVLKHKCHHCLIAVDARMQQIYWAVYEVNKDGLVELIGVETVCHPEQATIPMSVSTEKTWYGIGDGWKKYEAVLVKQLGFTPSKIDADLLPDARAMLELAKVKFEEGNQVELSKALPVYLRLNSS